MSMYTDFDFTVENIHHEFYSATSMCIIDNGCGKTVLEEIDDKISSTTSSIFVLEGSKDSPLLKMVDTANTTMLNIDWNWDNLDSMEKEYLQAILLACKDLL